MWLFFGVKLVGVWWGGGVCYLFSVLCWVSAGAGAPVGCAEVGFWRGADWGILGSGLVVVLVVYMWWSRVSVFCSS